MTHVIAADLVELLRSRAESNPTKTAYIFLLDDDREECSLTYAELDERARAVAVRLQQRIVPGDRALLLYPPVEFVEAFFGCLYAGVIAVPRFPPDPAVPQRMLSRINAIAADCAPTATFSVGVVAAAAPHLLEHAPALAGVPIVATDHSGESAAGSWKPVGISPDSVAFLQYTSGSTGTPKGVVLSHANLLHNERMIHAAMQQGSESILVSWLPLFHDMGLIGMVNYTAFLGADCVLMSPVARISLSSCAFGKSRTMSERGWTFPVSRSCSTVPSRCGPTPSTVSPRHSPSAGCGRRPSRRVMASRRRLSS